MDVSFETLAKNQRCLSRNDRFVRNCRQKSALLIQKRSFRSRLSSKINVAAMKINVSLKIVIQKQRCRYRIEWRTYTEAQAVQSVLRRSKNRKGFQASAAVT